VALANKRKGGRHRQNLTLEQEKELLLPFLEQAEAGGVLRVAPVQAAYEQMLGRPVHHSVVYLSCSAASRLAQDSASSAAPEG
jgi:hypothetical protein